MKSNPEWIKTLKVGDEIAYDMGLWYGKNYVIDKVIKITPSGIIKTERGRAFRPDGEIRGDGWFHLQPVTEEILSFNEKKKLFNYMREVKFEQLPIKKLREIYKIIKGDSANAEENTV